MTDPDTSAMVAVGANDPASTPIRVLLADDHEPIRTALRFVLDAATDVVVVGEAADGHSAVTNARALRPDVVLMDVQMPRVDGIDATREIVREELADVLVLTTFDLDEYVFGALRAGAAGFLLKTAEPGDILSAVRRVAAGDGVVAPEVTRQVLRGALA
jgi:DNA-binding NarL/FixJ family response regulator